jgi:ankyrin repeat protein
MSKEKAESKNQDYNDATIKIANAILINGQIEIKEILKEYRTYKHFLNRKQSFILIQAYDQIKYKDLNDVKFIPNIYIIEQLCKAAVRLNDLPRVKEYLELVGNDSEKRTRLLHEAIAFAIGSKQNGLAEKLFKLTLDDEERTTLVQLYYPGRNTLLHYASRWGDINMVNLLLNVKGIDASHKNLFDQTALQFAAYQQQDQKVIKKLLVDCLIDPEEKDRLGRTALNIAIIEGNKIAEKIITEFIKNKNALPSFSLDNNSASVSIFAKIYGQCQIL